ncbi:protein BIG GRAIN 1-like A [Henckelia pumila]|uniref:protein BIG GRAIN 1-like A n=1 Tax=Henckelia pumila TaxID=405737 RepID=UPI003C6DDB3C
MFKSDWEEKKYSRHSKNKPSFSSTLLDQIYRSIDDHDDDDHHKFKTSSKSKTTISWPEDNFFFKYSQTIKPVRTSSSSAPAASAKCREDDHDMIKFKSKILKKVKQPISPGGRLTTFLNSLFHKKQLQPKNNNIGNHSDRAHKYCICSATNNIHINALMPGSLIHMSRQRKSTQKHHREEDEDEDLSDSSSDLFELDVFANDQLPVYETTRSKRTDHATVPRFNIP